jgi:hypothetical protein
MVVGLSCWASICAAADYHFLVTHTYQGTMTSCVINMAPLVYCLGPSKAWVNDLTQLAPCTPCLLSTTCNCCPFCSRTCCQSHAAVETTQSFNKLVIVIIRQWFVRSISQLPFCKFLSRWVDLHACTVCLVTSSSTCSS